MISKKNQRTRRRRRIRAKIQGMTKRPRMAVYRSNKMLFVQLIDDEKRVTLVSGRRSEKNSHAAQELGHEVAKQALAKGIHSVVFDRGGYRYHGVIRLLAESAREEGLKI